MTLYDWLHNVDQYTSLIQHTFRPALNNLDLEQFTVSMVRVREYFPVHRVAFRFETEPDAEVMEQRLGHLLAQVLDAGVEITLTRSAEVVVIEYKPKEGTSEAP